MAITPQTDIKLLEVPLQIDNKNQLTFTNSVEQYNYFNSLPFLYIDNVQYQRKDNIIRFPAHIDKLLNYNYVMYQNENYTDKWFYAFITNMRYVNDNMTEITITTDVFQTWQFDFIFKESFIEREMLSVADDIPGANLVPEGLETGEFKCGGTASFTELEPAYIVAYIGDNYVTSKGNTINVSQIGYLYNGIYSAITFAVCDYPRVSSFNVNYAK